MSLANAKRTSARKSLIVIDSDSDSDVKKTKPWEEGSKPSPKRKVSLNSKATPAKNVKAEKSLKSDEKKSKKSLKEKADNQADNNEAIEEIKPKTTRKRVAKDDDGNVEKKPRVARKRVIKNEDESDKDEDRPKPKVARKTNSNATEKKPRVARKKVIKNEDYVELPKEDSDEDEENEQKPKVIRKRALIKEDPRLEVSRDIFDGDASFFQKPWKEHDLLSEVQNIDIQTAKNIIRLFQEENTIPFICRYRRELIGNMTPDELRDVKISYNHILNVHAKAETVMNNLNKEQKLTDDIKHDILCAKTVDEIDHLYAPYKPASKGSLADRAKALGLDDYAEDFLMGISPEIDIPALIKPEVEGLETKHKVEEGIQHIISFKFSKNTLVLEELRRLQAVYDIMLASTQISAKSRAKREDPKKPQKKVDEHKFENYFNFTIPTKYLKSHQILALNRGENLKVLSIKLTFKDNVRRDLHSFLAKQYLSEGHHYKERLAMFDCAFDEAYNKKLLPLMTRQVRSDLTKRAEKASVEVFANNLKQLLLTAPFKGEKILGIDPGFSNGCKMALISEQGEMLDSTVIYPHGSKSEKSAYIVTKILNENKCKIIALGNGTACRETEAFLSKLLDGTLENVKYSIVPEQGASIYSCGDIAKKEFPNLDVNLISAVSIARRLQDPLGEYVKIEPRHLGVGMYQHDLNEKILAETLDEVVIECVSFVGVDINTASVSLLSHVAGLTAKKAEYIIQYRTKNGPFKSREQLMKVKYIGEKTFVQCAGFLRIEPLTAGISENKINLLDCTWVHPESYDLAEKIIANAGLSNRQIGQKEFIEKISTLSAEKLTRDFDQPIERIECVLSALKRELLRDYRQDVNNQPLFKKGLNSMNDLKVGTILTGAVNNVTDFGCFVDIGVESNGLIHVSKLNGNKLNIGDRVEVSVLNIDIPKSRIGLKLEKVL